MMNVKLLTNTSKMPVKAHESDAGLDICSNQKVTIFPKDMALIKTGIAIQMETPKGDMDVYARIAPRSGLAMKGIDILAGVVDRGYTGEIGIPVINFGKHPLKIEVGDRIAQLIPTLIYNPILRKVDEIEITERKGNGFGSTGV